MCAASSRLRHEARGFDDIIDKGDADFPASGLKVSSLVRLGLLATIPRTMVAGRLGEISGERLEKLRARLARHIGK